MALTKWQGVCGMREFSEGTALMLCVRARLQSCRKRIESMRALAPEVRFSIIPHAQSLGNGAKKPYLSG